MVRCLASAPSIGRRGLPLQHVLVAVKDPFSYHDTIEATPRRPPDRGSPPAPTHSGDRAVSRMARSGRSTLSGGTRIPVDSDTSSSGPTALRYDHGESNRLGFDNHNPERFDRAQSTKASAFRIRRAPERGESPPRSWTLWAMPSCSASRCSATPRARPTDPKDDARIVCERLGERSDRDVEPLYGDETSHAQEHIRTRRAVPRERTEELRVHHVGDDLDGQAGRELPEGASRGCR